MSISREEQLRNNRRLSRQIVGAVAIVLIIIGLFTVLSWVVGVLRSALDDTERRQSYADRLYGLVMFDTMPFDDACRVPWRGDRAIVLYWGDVWLCDGKLAGTFSVYLCGVRNDSSILWSNELSDHIDSDRI